MDLTPFIGPLVGLVSGAIVATIAAFIPRKGSLENQLIDQLQQILERQDKLLEDKDTSIQDQKSYIKELEDYASVLRRQINDGDPPPPKPWPTRGKQ